MIEYAEQQFFNSLGGDIDLMNYWRVRSFVKYWKYLSQSGKYREALEKKSKQKEGAKIPKPDKDDDFWKNHK